VNGFRQPDPEVRARIAAVLKSEEGWLFSTADILPQSNLSVDTEPNVKR
jgi:hypothetical protein